MLWRNRVYLFGAAALLLVMGRATAFVVSPRHVTRISSSSLYSSPIPGEDRELLQKQLQESARQMKNMTPQQMEDMIADMDRMPDFQKQQLESMGMNMDVMKQTMRMLKDNPEQLQNMGTMMETMMPEQLVEQSKVAQENLKNLANLQQEENAALEKDAVTDAEIVKEEEEDDEEDGEEDDEDEEDDEPIVADPLVLDSMYKVAEIMSEPPEEGGVTFAGFQTVPPIAVLLAGTGEDDLTKQELTECWNNGSLGATRVDRGGFERVWNQAQEQYYNDIIEEARERTLVKKQKRGSEKPATSTPLSPTTPVVGAAMTPEQLSDQVKNMSEDDMSTMFERMNSMTKEDEERMKAMGVDPAMMKKSAEMMKNNPLLRKAATTMMKMTPPEQLMKASQQAQERMANMTEEEKKKMLDNLK